MYALDSTAIIVSTIGAVALVLAATIPLLVGVRRSLKRNVGIANGEGTLIEMVLRNSEQVGVIRADQIRSDARAAEVKLALEVHQAEVKEALAVQNRQLDTQSVHLLAHLEDHKAGIFSEGHLAVSGVLKVEPNSLDVPK